MSPQVGQVSRRKGARLHYLIDGVADCPRVRGRHAIHTTAVTADNAPLVCRCCRKSVLAAAELAEMDLRMRCTAGTRPESQGPANAAGLLVDALRTAAEKAAELAAREAFAAKFYAIRIPEGSTR
jgi:hypothetical protein